MVKILNLLVSSKKEKQSYMKYLARNVTLKIFSKISDGIKTKDYAGCQKIQGDLKVYLKVFFSFPS